MGGRDSATGDAWSLVTGKREYLQCCVRQHTTFSCPIGAFLVKKVNFAFIFQPKICGNAPEDWKILCLGNAFRLSVLMYYGRYFRSWKSLEFRNEKRVCTPVRR